MNRQEREVRNLNLSDEAELLQVLYSRYEEAGAELEHLLKDLMLDLKDPRVIYQMEYQLRLEAEIQDVLTRMNSDNTESVKAFLTTCAEIGFIGALYSVYVQGFSANFSVETIVNSDAELRMALWTANLQRDLKSEFTRGIAAGMSSDKIMTNAQSAMNSNLSRIATIARTEGGRVFEENNYAAMLEIQNQGATVMKEWSSVMDNKVRPDHQTLHGQVVPLDEPFVLHSEDGNTYEAMYPHGFGVAKEDINCRCTSVPKLVTEVNSGSVTQSGYENYETYAAFKKALLAGLIIWAAVGNKNRQDKS